MLSLVAAPVLYLLSVPPVYLMTLKTAPPGSGRVQTVPAWVEKYEEPYMWLSNRPLLGRQLSAYFLWWVDVKGGDGAW